MWASIFTQEEISTGGPMKTQASNTYQAYKHRGKQIKSFPKAFYIYGLLFFSPCTFLPISLLLSLLFLCCFCVVTFCLFLHWPIVMPLTPPVWCRFGSVCLWTDSPLSNGANVLLCGQSTVSWKWASNSNFQNKPTASSNLAWTCGCTCSLWWWGCKKGKKEEKTEEGEWVEAGVKRLAGSILAEDCPLPAHCVPCSMWGAVSTKKWMNNVTWWLEGESCCETETTWLLNCWAIMLILQYMVTPASRTWVKSGSDVSWQISINKLLLKYSENLLH